MAIKNEECPSCKSVGRDSTSNHLMVFSEGNTFCPKCKYTTTAAGRVINSGHLPSEAPPVIEKETFTPSHASLGPEDIALLPGDKIRSIDKRVVEAYGVKVEYDTATREISAHYYPMKSEGVLQTYKKRDCDTKEFFKLKKTKKAIDLFGKDLAKGKVPKKLLITEGELDAMAAHQMLWKTSDILCTSLPTGANVKAIQDDLKWLEKVDEIYLCYDQDDSGVSAVERTWELLPNVKVMEFSEKDADDMLTQMKSGEFVDSFLTAEKYKPRTLCVLEELIDSLDEPVPMGLSYGWSGLDAITYGIHLNSIIGIGAAPKAGKSTMMKAIQFQLMFVHSQPIGIIDVEKPGKMTLRELVGYQMGEKIHLPGATYDVPIAKATARRIEPLCNIYDHKYYNGTWEEIESVIRYLYSIGVRYFFIDPVSAIVSHLSASEANQWLSKAMFSMSKLVQSLDIAVFHVNHLNSPASGISHEEGGKIFGGSFTGSRAQYRYSHLLIGLERDQHAPVEEDRDTSTVRIVGDRLTGNTGRTTKLKYDSTTGRLNEKPIIF